MRIKEKTSRICSKCHAEKPIKEFRSGWRGQHFAVWCRACRILHPKEWYKQSATRRNLKYNFNLSLEDYNKLLRKQKEVCMICGKTDPAKRRLAVDHCHETGKIRGLLCTRCNCGLSYISWFEHYNKKIKKYIEKASKRVD